MCSLVTVSGDEHGRSRSVSYQVTSIGFEVSTLIIAIIVNLSRTSSSLNAQDEESKYSIITSHFIIVIITRRLVVVT